MKKLPKLPMGPICLNCGKEQRNRGRAAGYYEEAAGIEPQLQWSQLSVFLSVNLALTWVNGCFKWALTR